MTNPLRVGDLLEGYLEGFFSGLTGPARVEAVGADWVVLRSYGDALAETNVDPDYLTKFRPTT